MHKCEFEEKTKIECKVFEKRKRISRRGKGTKEGKEGLNMIKVHYICVRKCHNAVH
jgi:hypothetical protein